MTSAGKSCFGGRLALATSAPAEHVRRAPREGETAAAIAAAKAAQPAWAALPNIERAGYLRKIAALLRDRADEFADMLVVEQGKTRGLATVEANFTADYLDYMAEWARRIEGEVIPSDRAGEMILLTRRPIGVVGGILPWNFPFFLIARKMAPALLTGNTIVINPSSETPVNALEFAKLVDEAGVPAGVFNLVSGRGRVVGETLSTHPDVGMISMTGSVSVGKRIMEKAAPTLTRVNLELGGKAPAIVLASADLDLAAKAIWDSRVINTGQVCNCAEVVLVDDAVHDELVTKLKELFDATRYGDTSEIEELDEALEIANASRFGLTSSVYTDDLNQALKAVEGLQYGETYVNRENFEVMQGFHAGRRESGIGGADGKHGLLEFTETHVAYIQRN
ncbi:MAG TPA: aldehyde dehydrogenase family protein [Corynebacterium xerosis]|uniref:aldehyde dehydrogenase family protein n=1 Tax=Corynebacterium xerosis TaxID=1725 RepID=UPI001D93CE07|nr:aldehyde dehydrogenase family protein [Corynebacterium xerosis]HJG57410.1 aldehyde dehydrogenase family protein [Corynebacterium xerosis]